MVTDAPIPTLSPRESHLLAAFLAAHFDLFQLAAAENLSHDELLAFASSPAVHARLDSLRRFAESAFTLRTIHNRQQAIDALASACKSSTDPVETRRCATALLRGLSLHSPRPPRPARSTPSDLHPISLAAPATEPQSPDLSAHDTRAQDVPEAPAPAHDPHSLQAESSCPPEPRNGHHPAEGGTHPFHARIEASIADDDPTPRAVPSPHFTDRDVARIIADAIQLCDVRALLTITYFLTVPASINSRPASSFVEELVEVLPNEPFDRVEFLEEEAQVTDLSATYTLHIHTASGIHPLTLNLVVAQGCWRLAQITTHPTDSS
ncbi:MAG: hypothetical protein KF678_09630 [Phycisphaeraceae bacterium]|nr:hypothetical protein [Phycisphaeraceae bacterium]